jgi:hypothetical protein
MKIGPLVGSAFVASRFSTSVRANQRIASLAIFATIRHASQFWIIALRLMTELRKIDRDPFREWLCCRAAPPTESTICMALTELAKVGF